MADEQVNATALVAFQVLPAIGVFVAGFSSVRLHAHRDRALARLDRMEGEIRRVVDLDEASADRELKEHAQEYARTIQEWPSVSDMVRIHLVLVGMLLLLQIAAGIAMKWEFEPIPFRWSLDFLGFLILFMTQVGVLIVGYLDARKVRAQLLERRTASLWSRIATLVHRLDVEQLDEAQTLAYQIFEEAPGAAWAARLHGRVQLEIARKARDDTTRAEAIHDSIAEFARALDLRALQKRSPAAELKLRSEAQELSGSLEYALDDIDEALKWDKHDPELWVRSAELNAKIARLNEDRGDSSVAAVLYQIARHGYDQATQLDLLSVEPLLAWARLERHTKNFRRALELVQTALRLQPNNKEALDMQRRITAELGQPLNEQ